MNDRFKFRGMTLGGEWVYGNLAIINKKIKPCRITIDEGYYISNEVGMPFAYPVRPETIGQCTGFSDKNGNLIYENDRVGFYVYGQDEEWHAQQGTVIWYNSCWGIETSSRFIQFENELTIKNPKDIEIIGNIHENKGE